jgi:hypothetical protein
VWAGFGGGGVTLHDHGAVRAVCRTRRLAPRLGVADRRRGTTTPSGSGTAGA